jgi:NAD(P)-dependent dehydrogenase (short-subunit alcohol dehydrogenase family)
MDLGLKGKSVLITGASKGIGLACARGFAAEGSTVHLAARSADLLAKVCDELQSAYKVPVHTHRCDLRAPGAVKQLAQDCASVDILVNNAGDIPGGNIETVNEELWRHAWELKVFGYINLTRELYTRMKARGRGVIVNIVGMAGVTLPPEYLCGAMGNAALEAFTKAVGKGSIEHGVRVLGVHPPATRTDRIIQLNKTISKQKFGDESRWEELLKQTRMIEPEQVADTTLYFASERANHLSGVMLNLGTY